MGEKDVNRIMKDVLNNEFAKDVALKFGKMIAANMDVDVSLKFLNDVYEKQFKDKFIKNLK